MKKKSPSNKIVTLSLHFLAWFFVVAIPIFIVRTYFGDDHVSAPYRFLGFIIPIALVFYLNYMWLVPRYFFTGKKVKYFIMSFLMIWAVGMFSGFSEQMVTIFLEDHRMPPSIPDFVDSNIKDFRFFWQLRALGFFFIASLIWGFSFGLAILRKWSQTEKERKELEKEKLNSELAFLKNQISPHFFFNTLNNIYSLIGIDQNDAQEAVHKLSKLMRYLIYDSEKGHSKLSEEVVFMANYIDLMRLRLSSKVSLSVTLPDDCRDIAIPPLLFISFVENAFKHGVSYREKSFIDINMTIEENHIRFLTVNSIGTSSNAEDSQYGGIGLENVKKRLALLYPGKHVLKAEKSEEKYIVELVLDI